MRVCEGSLSGGTSQHCLSLQWSFNCSRLCQWEERPEPFLRPLPSCQWNSAVLTRRWFMVGPAAAKRIFASASWLDWGWYCGRLGAMAWGQEENFITHHGTESLFAAQFWAQHLCPYFSSGLSGWDFRLCKCGLVKSELSSTRRLRVNSANTSNSSLDEAEEQIFPLSIRVEFFRDSWWFNLSWILQSDLMAVSDFLSRH